MLQGLCEEWGGDVSGAELQPLVCEMLRSDRSVGSLAGGPKERLGQAIVRWDRSAGRSFGRAIVRSDRSAGRPAGGPAGEEVSNIKGERAFARAFGRNVRPGEAGGRQSEQYQGRKSVRSSVRRTPGRAGPAGRPADETPHTHTKL